MVATPYSSHQKKTRVSVALSWQPPATAVKPATIDQIDQKTRHVSNQPIDTATQPMTETATLKPEYSAKQLSLKADTKRAQPAAPPQKNRARTTDKTEKVVEPTAPSRPSAKAHPVRGLHRAPLVTRPLFAAPPKAPNYPTVARKRGQQGTVWLDIWLDADGRQDHRKISKSSGVEALDNAALDAVSSWRFKPYRIDGHTVPSRVRVPVKFALNEKHYR